jgi:hypothetical protein
MLCVGILFYVGILIPHQGKADRCLRLQLQLFCLHRVDSSAK